MTDEFPSGEREARGLSEKDMRSWVMWILGVIVLVLGGYIKIQEDIRRGDEEVSRASASARQEQSIQMKEIRDELRSLNAYLRDSGRKP